jgi:acetyl esterase/lipase
MRTRQLLPATLAVSLLLLSVSLTARADEPQPPTQSAATPPDAAPPNEIVVEENVVYGEAGGEKLTLHLARPANTDTPSPGLLIIHRGGWVGGSKDRYRAVIEEFARHGYVTVSVGYRFAPKHKFPAQIEDCKCAVRWMRAHAKELGVDHKRIGAMGESAGAYLSMMLGMLDPEDGMEGEGGWPDQPSKVQAVVSFYGPTDLRWESIATNAPPEFLSGVARRLLTAYVGGAPEKSSEILFKASPIKYVDKRDAPTMQIQGTADPLVLPSQALLMSDALTKAGVAGRTELVNGLGHDWDGEEFYEPLQRARNFLDEHLKASNDPESASSPAWNPTLAAKYLDDRAIAWREWPKSKQADGTSCVACHTGFPYLIGRAALARRMKQSAPAEPLKQTWADVSSRVENWDKLEPWYHFSDDKSAESRGTEAVLNAAVLTIKDAESPLGGFSGNSKRALANLWATQRSEGEAAGSWPWLAFQLEPWESTAAEFWGASLAALAVGITPEAYQQEEGVAPKVALLREYLRRNMAAASLHNRAWLLLASLRLSDVLKPEEQQQIAAELLAAQRADGGWSLGTLGEWKLPNDTSDGYATGLFTYVLLQFDRADYRAAAMRGAHWLVEHQDPTTGAWPTASVNAKRDPSTFVGQFMQDAATSFAVFALAAAE